MPPSKGKPSAKAEATPATESSTKPPAPVPALSESAIDAELEKHHEWSQIGDMIQRTYQFKDFIAAMRFVDRVAVIAEKTQHHPDILIRYSRVTLSSTTHDAGGISYKDFDLAAECDKIASK